MQKASYLMQQIRDIYIYLSIYLSVCVCNSSPLRTCSWGCPLTQSCKSRHGQSPPTCSVLGPKVPKGIAQQLLPEMQRIAKPKPCFTHTPMVYSLALNAIAKSTSNKFRNIMMVWNEWFELWAHNFTHWLPVPSFNTPWIPPSEACTPPASLPHFLDCTKGVKTLECSKVHR